MFKCQCGLFVFVPVFTFYFIFIQCFILSGSIASVWVLLSSVSLINQSMTLIRCHSVQCETWCLSMCPCMLPPQHLLCLSLWVSHHTPFTSAKFKQSSVGKILSRQTHPHPLPFCTVIYGQAHTRPYTTKTIVVQEDVMQTDALQAQMHPWLSVVPVDPRALGCHYHIITLLMSRTTPINSPIRIPPHTHKHTMLTVTTVHRHSVF